MFDKALKLAAVLMVAGGAAGPLSQNCLAMLKGKAAARVCAHARAGLPEVCEVSIRRAAHGAVLIDIATSRPIPYRVIRLGSPGRLVVDFEGARNAARRGVYRARSKILAGVRIAQWRANRPAIVRVVADLEGSPAFGIERQSWGVRIELKPGAAQTRGQALPNPFRDQSRSKFARYSAKVSASRGRSPGSELPVHQFADLTASLTGPEIPPQDRLIPLVKERPLENTRGNLRKMALVYGVSIKPDVAGETLVDIASSQSVPYRVFQLMNPPRLVVDLKDARDASPRNVYPVQSPVLRQVRMGQWRAQGPAVVRIVADLEGFPMFDVHAEQPGVRIELKPRRALGPLVRNPFEFTREGPSVKIARPSGQAAYVPAARTIPAPALDVVALSNLKVLGYLEKPGKGTEAIVSDNLNIYFVPEGGAFEDRFRLLKITGTAVEIEDLNTKQTAWLQFTP